MEETGNAKRIGMVGDKEIGHIQQISERKNPSGG